MTAYVFLGPSLPVEEASRILEATYLPPVQQGDILRLLRRKPRVIGIVDGYFEIVPAVWHKEILFAIESGAQVFGAASMGALRAAELHPFGMIGVGEIFEWYRDGVLLDDDEVAVSHAPAELNYVPLSDALVDIRDCCIRAVNDGVLPLEAAQDLIRFAKSLPYASRSYAALAEHLGRTSPDISDAWLTYCRSSGKGLKARDATALLNVIRQSRGDTHTPQRTSVAVERTVYFEHLRNEIALEAVAGAACDDEGIILRAGQSLKTLRHSMLLRLLARQAGGTYGWELTVEEVNERAIRFCSQFSLSQPNQRQAWMDAEGISDRDFWTYINDLLLIEKLEHLHSDEIERSLADHLRMLTAGERSGATPQAVV